MELEREQKRESEEQRRESKKKKGGKKVSAFPLSLTPSEKKIEARQAETLSLASRFSLPSLSLTAASPFREDWPSLERLSLPIPPSRATPLPLSAESEGKCERT